MWSRGFINGCRSLKMNLISNGVTAKRVFKAIVTGSAGVWISKKKFFNMDGFPLQVHCRYSTVVTALGDENLSWEEEFKRLNTTDTIPKSTALEYTHEEWSEHLLQKMGTVFGDTKYKSFVVIIAPYMEVLIRCVGIRKTYSDCPAFNYGWIGPISILVCDYNDSIDEYEFNKIEDAYVLIQLDNLGGSDTPMRIHSYAGYPAKEHEWDTRLDFLPGEVMRQTTRMRFESPDIIV